MKPRLFMLVGAPGTGKSTWIATQPFDWNRTVVISSDGHVERYAATKGKTYNDVFSDYIKTATGLMHDDLAMAIDGKYDIIWDQTNMSDSNRRGKLQKIPAEYEKYAVVFLPPSDKEHQRRLLNRPGKSIPTDVINSMLDSFVMPSEKEGFDDVIVVKN